MPQVEIRPAVSGDLPYLIEMDHGYKSNYVWQMDLASEEGQMGVQFREIRLPRPVRVEYPRPYRSLVEDWTRRSCVLVGTVNREPAGYLSILENISPTTAWITDLVVAPDLRRQGIASALILAAQDWSRPRNNRRIILEMQSKNTPAIHLAQKLGYEFCGYNDHYFTNQDIALFFGQFLR